MTAPAKTSRRVTYGSANRITKLVELLRKNPRGLSYAALEERLDVSRRTLQRYIANCQEKLTDEQGRPLVEVCTEAERRIVRLTGGVEAVDGTAWELFSVFLGLRLGHLLEGTVVGEMNEGFWDKVKESASPEHAKHLKNIERKLCSLPSMPRDYSEKDELLDDLLKALVHQVRLRVDYRGVVGEGRTHEFDPYSLVEHRGGLYLLGKSHLEGKMIWLAVERIRSAKQMRDGGTPIKFAYPAHFDPLRHADGMFGVFDGKKVRVVLALQNETTESYLRARRIHPTQRFFRGTDGRTHLEMTVRGTKELLNWLMSSSPWVEVLEPAELRREIADRLEQSRAAYAPARPPARAEAPTKKPARGRPTRARSA